MSVLLLNGYCTTICCIGMVFSKQQDKKQSHSATHSVDIVYFDATTSNSLYFTVNHYNVYCIFDISVPQIGIGHRYMYIVLWFC